MRAGGCARDQRRRTATSPRSDPVQANRVRPGTPAGRSVSGSAKMWGGAWRADGGVLGRDGRTRMTRMRTHLESLPVHERPAPHGEEQAGEQHDRELNGRERLVLVDRGLHSGDSGAAGDGGRGRNVVEDGEMERVEGAKRRGQ